MARSLDLDELVEQWTLLDDEQALIAGKRGATRRSSLLAVVCCAPRRTTSGLATSSPMGRELKALVYAAWVD
jgi:hypothetical protein